MAKDMKAEFKLACAIIATLCNWTASAQLPLTVTSAHSEYWEDITRREYDWRFQEEYYVTVGYVFGVTIGFRVDDQSFWDEREFCMYVVRPDEVLERITIDSTMMYSNCDNCLEVTFKISTTSAGWLACYCFPKDYHIPKLSLEYLNRSEEKRLVYLRVPVSW
jgi:hypothetical protein